MYYSNCTSGRSALSSCDIFQRAYSLSCSTDGFVRWRIRLISSLMEPCHVWPTRGKTNVHQHLHMSCLRMPNNMRHCYYVSLSLHCLVEMCFSLRPIVFRTREDSIECNIVTMTTYFKKVKVKYFGKKRVKPCADVHPGSLLSWVECE